MTNSQDQNDRNIPPQPESSAGKQNDASRAPQKPSQAEGDEETVDKALRDQEQKSK